jgi:hypothetical protein
MPTSLHHPIRTLLALCATAAVVLGSASPAGASGPGPVTVSPTPNQRGWITTSGATVTVKFDVDGFAPSERNGAYDELVNKIECSGEGVSGGNFDGPGALLGNFGMVTTTFNVTGDSPSPAGSGVGCKATYQRLVFSNCSTWGCTRTMVNPSGTASNGTTIRIDSSPPRNVAGHPVVAPAALDWHNVPTVVNFRGEDTNSGIESCTGSVPIGGPSSKSPRVASGTCTNRAGLMQGGVPYRYRFDDTRPTLAPTVSSDQVVLGSDLTATPNASDEHSGVESASCETPDTSTLGTHAVRCTATDVATNSASAEVTYEVVPAPSDDPAPTDEPGPTDDPDPIDAGRTSDTGQTGSGATSPQQEQEQQQAQPLSPPAITLTGSLGAIKGNKIKRSQLKKGYPLQVTCAADSDAAVTLTVTSSVAKKLKLKVPKGQRTVTIGSATGQCKATGGGTPTLKLARSAKSNVLKSKSAIAVKLELEYTKPGSAPFKISRWLKLT